MPAPGQSPERSAKALLLEGVNDSAVELIGAAGYSNLERLTKALDGEALRAGAQGRASCSASAPAPRSPTRSSRPPTG